MASICCNCAAIAYLLHCSVLILVLNAPRSNLRFLVAASFHSLLQLKPFSNLGLHFFLQNSFKFHESTGRHISWMNIIPLLLSKYWKGLKKAENKWGGFIFASCESPEPTWERCCKICFTSCLHFSPKRGIDSFQKWKRISCNPDSRFHEIQIFGCHSPSVSLVVSFFVNKGGNLSSVASKLDFLGRRWKQICLFWPQGLIS